MKLTLPRAALLRALKHVLPAVETSATLPILTHVLLRKEGDHLALTGSDMQVEAIGHIKLTDDCGTDGAVCVPAKKLADIARLAADEADLVLDLRGEQLHVTADRSRFRLATLPAAQYPDFDRDDVVATLTLDAATLQLALDAVAGAMAVNDVRFYLNGAQLALDGTELVATASDGHRVSRYRAPTLSAIGKADCSAILPRSAALDIAKLIRSAPPTVTVAIGHRTITLTIDHGSYAARTIEGAYPDVKRAIPTDTALTVHCGRVDLSRALQRVATLSNEKYRGVKLDFQPDHIAIDAGNAAAESASDTVEADIDGEPRMGGICVDYLLSALDQITADQVHITVSGNGMLILADPNDDRYFALICPMRL